MKRRQTRVVGNTCVYYVMYVSVENALLGHKEPETDGDITDQTERARLSRTGLSSLLNPGTKILLLTHGALSYQTHSP